jgi:hypothetical protein
MNKDFYESFMILWKGNFDHLEAIILADKNYPI